MLNFKAGSYSKYVGYLELEFDENGELMTPIKENGVKNAQPILLDYNVPDSPEVGKSFKALFFQILQKYYSLFTISNHYSNLYFCLSIWSRFSLSPH